MNIDSKISNLLEDDDRKETLRNLQSYINTHGIDQSNLEALFELVFHSKLSNNEKKFIIKNLLIPNGSYIIDFKILYQIISAVGYPRTYFKGGKKVTQKKLSMSTQQLLLHWLVSSIHLFGDKIYKKLHNLLPVLFNLLSFEFLRPSIANLIFLTVLNTNKSISFKDKYNLVLIKQWQIQLTVDLALKFPLDESLKNLLVLFKEVIPSLDYKLYTKKNMNFVTKISKPFKYPDTNFLAKLSEVNTSNSQSNVIINNNLNQYNTFDRMIRKRRKINSEEILDIEILNPDSISIYDYNSLITLVLDLSKITYLNYHSLLNNSMRNYNNRFRVHCLVLKALIDDEDPVVTKFHSFVNHKIELLMATDTLPLEPVFDRLSELQLIYPVDLGRLMAFRTNNPSVHMSILKLMRNSGFDRLNLNFDLTLLKNYKTDKINENLIIRFFHEFSVYVNHGQFSDKFASLVSLVFEFFDENIHYFTVAIKLSFMKVLKSLQSTSESVQDKIGHILLSIPMINKLLLTSNPIIVSETCGYILFLKKLNYNKQLQSHLVMDTLNFISRDKSFHYIEGTTNKGMLLNPKLIDKLSTLNTFGYSNLTRISTIGNLFHNPAWSFITAEIIWNLEDKHHVSKRHPGPITDESVEKIEGWIDLNYEQVKLQVLRELDRLGYKGLADLLFGSLRSLERTRQSIIVE